MANSLSVKITEDGPRNAIVKVVGVVDSADMNAPQSILLSDFKGNDARCGRLNGLSFWGAQYTVTSGLVVVFAWNSNSPEQLCALSESGEICLRRTGGHAPDRLASGYEGSINLATRGFKAGSVYGFTVELSLVKKYAQ